MTEFTSKGHETMGMGRGGPIRWAETCHVGVNIWPRWIEAWPMERRGTSESAQEYLLHGKRWFYWLDGKLLI